MLRIAHELQFTARGRSASTHAWPGNEPLGGKDSCGVEHWHQQRCSGGSDSDLAPATVREL